MGVLSQVMVDGQARPPVVSIEFIRPADEDSQYYQRLEWPAQLLHHLQIKSTETGEMAGVPATKWVNQDVAATNREARKTRERLELLKQARECGMEMPRKVLETLMKQPSLGTQVHKLNEYEFSSDEEGLASDDDDNDAGDPSTDQGFIDLTSKDPTPEPPPEASGSQTLFPLLEEPASPSPQVSPARIPVPSAGPSKKKLLLPPGDTEASIRQEVRDEVRKQMESLRQDIQNVMREDRENIPPPPPRDSSPLGRYNIGSGNMMAQPQPVNITINTIFITNTRILITITIIIIIIIVMIIRL